MASIVLQNIGLPCGRDVATKHMTLLFYSILIYFIYLFFRIVCSVADPGIPLCEDPPRAFPPPRFVVCAFLRAIAGSLFRESSVAAPLWRPPQWRAASGQQSVCASFREHVCVACGVHRCLRQDTMTNSQEGTPTSGVQRLY